jgi:hypothetical protein
VTRNVEQVRRFTREAKANLGEHVDAHVCIDGRRYGKAVKGGHGDGSESWSGCLVVAYAYDK